MVSSSTQPPTSTEPELRDVTDNELTPYVECGYRYNKWLWNSSAELDTFVHENEAMFGVAEHETSQYPLKHGLAPLHEWTNYLGTEGVTRCFRPVKGAIYNLTVGTHDPAEKWDSYRTVDTDTRKDTYFNVPIRFVQDKTYRQLQGGQFQEFPVRN